ncbi:hypothetical protein R1sor_024697 [Riccia sorocarpa]|uniref:DDE Tnp4 domain-containing protein n=1 Tax=Riccia sorocarpa TaxID=122646 RepID=A0ABD3GST9_9MARC
MDKVGFNTCVAHARVGNEHCIGILKARWHSLKEIRTQLRNPAENAYVIRWMRCFIILHNFLIWRRDEWSEDDHPIEVEREDDLGPPPQGARQCSRRGLERRQAVQRGGALTFRAVYRGGRRELHQVEVDIEEGGSAIYHRSSAGSMTTAVREFVLNWDERTQSNTVGSREIPLTIDTMREYFLLPEGLNPPRSARHYDELSDWVPEWSKTTKTWTCGIVDDEDIVLSDSDKSVEEATPPRSASPPPVQVVSSSTSPDRVQDPSSSSPEHVRNSSPNSPERVVASSSSSPDRRHLSQDPKDIPSTSSPGSTRQASLRSPDRQHSHESSPGGRLVHLVTTPLAVGHQAARTARNRLIMNLWLGLDRPWCRIRHQMTMKKGPLKGLLKALRSWVQQTSPRQRRVSDPCCTGALLNLKRSDLPGQTA